FTPHFLDENLNGGNFIAGGGPEVGLLDPQRRLARILDLAGLGETILWSKARGDSDFRYFTGPPTRENVGAWLDRQIPSRTGPELVLFIQSILTALGDSQDIAPFHPAWATTWDALREFLAEGPERWCEVLGMFRSLPAWIIVLTYSA